MAMAGGQVAHSPVSGLLAGGEPPAPGELPDGDGLVELVISALGAVGWTAGAGVLGVLAFLAGGAWMWGKGPRATGEERRRDR